MLKPSFTLAVTLHFAALLLCAPPSTAADFRLGVVNERPDQPDIALEQYGKLAAYLDRELSSAGVGHAKLVIARNLVEMRQRVTAGEVDAVFEGVFTTIAINGDSRMLDPALLIWRKGQREYRSVFFTRKDSPIHSLADLRGKVVAFEAPRSTSAFGLPVAALRRSGLKVASTENGTDSGSVNYVFVGSEANQGYWVQRGQADAAAFNNGDWERLPQVLRDDLRIFHETPTLPRWLASFRTGLDPAVRRAVTDALSTMHETDAGREALKAAEHITRIEPLTPEDFESIRRWTGVARQVAIH